MNDSYWQTEVGFNYRHILPNKNSNSGDIFDPYKNEKYKDYTVFTMLRTPLDRITSEYHFIRERREFTTLLKKQPKNFESYIKNVQTNNGVVNFLKGRRMYSSHRASENDLEEILESINKIPIHVGIFEHFNDSLSYFSSVSNIKWKKNIDVKRMTFKRPLINEIPNDIIELINDKNSLDQKLYNFCLSRFKIKTLGLNKKNITFIKDKYNHVIPYCIKWCFFEFCLDNKKFIKVNIEYFKSLTFFLIEKKKINDGRVYTRIWNNSFINAFDDLFKGTKLNDLIKNSYDRNTDPLEQLILIARIIDNYLSSPNGDRENYYKSLQFVPEKIILEKKGFLSSFFKS
jgi:hypothetical protein